MMKTKKILKIALVLALSVGCILVGVLWSSGLVAPIEQDEPASELEFYQQREEAINAFACVLEAFAQEYPEGQIVQNRVPNPLEYLSARIQRGDIPDIFTHWPTQASFVSTISMGEVLPLGDQPFLDRVEDGALELCRQSSGGEIYALPINRNCMEVYYNVDLFRELGLSEPNTVEELLAACDVIRAAGTSPMIFYLRDNRTAHVAQAIMAALNEDYLTLLGQASDGTIDERDWEHLMDSLRLMRRLYTNYSGQNAGHTFYEACENFARGDSAMIITGSYALSLFRDMEPEFEMGVFVFPGEDPQRRTILSSIDTAVCVSTQCADVDLALAFLEFLTRPEVIQEYVLRDGAPSCIEGVYQEDPLTRQMQEHISNYENEEWIKSCYSLESSLAFENLICSYMISGDEHALERGLKATFQSSLNS